MPNTIDSFIEGMRGHMLTIANKFAAAKNPTPEMLTTISKATCGQIKLEIEKIYAEKHPTLEDLNAE